MRLNKLLSWFVAIACACNILCPAATAESFSQWSDENIYAGTTEATKLAQRADIKNLAYIFSETFVLETSPAISLKDCSSDSPFYQYICNCISAGVLKTTDNRVFPDEVIKRGQLYKYFSWLNVPGCDSYQSFCDKGYIDPIGSSYEPDRIASIHDIITALNRIFPYRDMNLNNKTTVEGTLILRERSSLSNVFINGDLYVCGSDLVLTNVHISGMIIFIQSTISKTLVLNECNINNIDMGSGEMSYIDIRKSDIGSIRYSSKLINITTDNRDVNLVKV